MKLTQTFAGLSLLASFGAIGAEAQEFTGPNGSTVTLYGQLNPAYLSFDDGQETKGLIVDNADSNSRVGLWLVYPFANDTKLRFNFETGLGFLQSNAVNMGPTPDFLSWDDADIRKLELTYGGGFGAVWAGQGSMATDSIAETDFSKTAVVGYSDYQAVAGGFQFRQKDGTLSSVTLKSVFTNLEGTRRWRLRYDTPEMSGFTVSAAYGKEILTTPNNNRYYDAAVRYANTFGDVKVGGGLGYNVTEADNGDGAKTENLMGSVSMLHSPTGLNFTLAAGSVIDGGDYVYAKAGWIADLTKLGATAFAAEYYTSTDIGVDDGSGKSWGLMVVQPLDAYKTELYAGYRNYELDTADVAYMPAQSVFVGARWKF